MYSACVAGPTTTLGMEYNSEFIWSYKNNYNNYHTVLGFIHVAQPLYIIIMVAMHQKLSSLQQEQMNSIRALSITLDGGACNRVLNSYNNCFKKDDLEAIYKELKVA